MRHPVARYMAKRHSCQRRLSWPVLLLMPVLAMACAVGAGYTLVPWLTSLWCLGSCLAAFGMPLVASVLAATMTAEEARSSQYELVTLTAVEDDVLVKGLFRAAVNRTFGLLIFSGLFLLSLLLMLNVVLVRLQRELSSSNLYSESPSINWLGMLLLNGALLIGLFALWSLNLTGLAFGVGAGLRWRNVSQAAVFAPIGFGGCMFCSWIGISFTSGFAGSLGGLALICIFPLMLSLPFVMIALVINEAAHSARRHME